MYQAQTKDLVVPRQVVDGVFCALGNINLELVDIELLTRTLKVTVDAADDGLDLDRIEKATRLISTVLDELSYDPFPVSNYTLEVSSPGIARSLRTLEQFQHYLGSVISLKTRPGFEGPRRVQGRLMETNETEVSLKTNNRIVTFPYDWIETARTVVDWQMPDDDNTPNSDNEVVL